MRLRRLVLEGDAFDADTPATVWLPVFEPPLEPSFEEPVVVVVYRGGRAVMRVDLAGQYSG